MAVIISQNGKNATKIDRTSFDSEDELQNYIYENPDVVPLYEIKEDIRVCILARELSTQSGPIDAVGVDQDGEIYLIETKLYKNQDKRHVVAQVLDYGASLWRHFNDSSRFIAMLEDSVQEKFGMSLYDKLGDFFSIEAEEAADLTDTVRNNLDHGKFKFVVLMDQLHDQLKDLILFLNQNSKFDVYAVELEYYKHQTYEIMIPRLFGAEVKKSLSPAVSRRENVSLEEFLDRIENPISRSLFEKLRESINTEFPESFEKINPTGASWRGPSHPQVFCEAYPFRNAETLGMRLYFRNNLVDWNSVKGFEVSPGKKLSNIVVDKEEQIEQVMELANQAYKSLS